MERWKVVSPRNMLVPCINGNLSLHEICWFPASMTPPTPPTSPTPPTPSTTRPQMDEWTWCREPVYRRKCEGFRPGSHLVHNQQVQIGLERFLTKVKTYLGHLSLPQLLYFACLLTCLIRVLFSNCDGSPDHSLLPAMADWNSSASSPVSCFKTSIQVRVGLPGLLLHVWESSGSAWILAHLYFWNGNDQH